MSSPLVMGVVNVTPDSFSDGGRWASTETAIARGRELLAQGADILDIGGESTRPGATRPVLADELDRVVPVIRDLAAGGARISVDTMRAEVARAAVDAGAVIVNDVSGGLADPRILQVCAEASVTYVAMHWRAHAAVMAEFTDYPRGVVAEVVDELARRRDAALAAGVAVERLVLDPGLGFAKTAEHNWELLAGLDRLAALGHPLLVGASRKTFLGRLLGEGDRLRPVDGREFGTAALSLLLADAGVWCLRVHDVRATQDALAVRTAWRAAESACLGGSAERAGPTSGAGRVEASRTDELAVDGIECFAHHGVFADERREGQRFVVDLVLGVDIDPAARSDDLHDTVDYGTLTMAVKAAVESDPVDLIETVAQRIADVCLRVGRVEWVRVTLHKPDAPIPTAFENVALSIERKRGRR